MINGINSNIDYVEESDYSFASRNIDIWHGDFPHKQGDNFPDAKIKKRASISKTNRLLFNNDYTSILNKMLDVIPEIDPIYGMQIKEIVGNIPYFKTVVDGFISLICSTMPIIDSPDSIDARLSTILADSNLYSTLDYRFKSMFMDVIDVYVVSRNSQGKAYIKTIPVKNCIVYNDCNDITSTYCIEVFNITDEIIEFINYFIDGRIEKRTFKYSNGTIGEQVGEVEKTLAYNGKYNVCPAGFIKHNVENPDDTYGIDQFRYWDSSITAVCRSFVNLFRLNEKCREILRKVPESSLSRLNSGSYSFINKGTIVYPDGVTKEQRPDIEYIIPELRNNIESEIQVLDKSIKLVHTIRGVLRPAFQLAVESNYIFINPFNFELKDVLINDSIKREAVDIKTENKFLKFLKEDEYYNSIYDGALILFKTGLRISELCGLTLSDIDLDKRTIDINHQLQYNTGVGKNIRATKTDAGSRVLPMSNEVYKAFVRVVNSRKAPDIEEIIEDSDGKKYTGFLFLDNKGKSTVAYYWEKRFQHAVKKHNTIFKDELPVIVPHMCRHTYCTRMAVSGVSPNTLKYLMGHSDIQTTLNVYTHTKYDDAKKELEQIEAMRELENLNGTNSDKVVKFPNPA